MPTQDCVLGRRGNGRHALPGDARDRRAAASTAGAAKRGTYDIAVVLPRDAGAVRVPGVPRLSRRLGRPRHAGGAYSRALHARLRIRPKTQSWVALVTTATRGWTARAGRRG